MQLNENLLKNRDVWKAKILEVEVRYWFLPLCVLNFSFYIQSQNFNHLMSISNLALECLQAVICLIGPFFLSLLYMLVLTGRERLRN